MHFVGMQAILLPGSITYDRDLLVASLVAGLIGTITATALIAHRRPGWASVFLTLAVTATHFIAVGSLHLNAPECRVHPDARHLEAGSGDRRWRRLPADPGTGP